MRRQILPGVDDQSLARLLIELQAAHSSYFAQFGIWGGFGSRSVLNFLKVNTQR